MGTNPEGSRDLRDARDDASARPMSAVTGPSQDEVDFADEYDAALEEGPRPATRSFDIQFGSGDRSGEDDGSPTSVDGPKPSGDEEEDTIQVQSTDRKAGAAQASAAKRDGLFGQVLADRYRILDLIGKGGMGKVYLAEHVALGKKVAVKVLNPAYTNRPDQVKRFLREARAASTIGHENVIDITDVDEMPNGQVFFAMEHLQGEDLGKVLKKAGPIPWGRARRIILQICRALQAAHGKGIIHRDMKPENCFLIQRNGIRDFIKVLDFGIAKFLEENRDGGSNPLTQIGALIGTPEYMAPEQIQGEPADLRMDIYAVGCIMYQLLTGNLPFTDKTMYGVLSQQVNARPIPPRQLAPDADIPPEVEAIILRAMEKDKTLRYQSMGELIEAILAAPRGTAGSSMDGRMGTTTNLDAAASAARIAAGMGTTSLPVVPGNPVTPQDVSIAPGSLMGSASGMAPTAVGGTAIDPKMLTRLVIGLGAVVLVLLVGLVCALSRDDEAKPPADALAEGASEAKDEKAEPTPPEPDIKATTPPEPTPKTTTPPRPEDDPIIVPDDPEPKKVEPKKVEPKKTEPKKTEPKKTEPKKTDSNMAGWPEELGPVERSQVNKTYKATFETCRTISTPKGKTYKIKLKIEGPTGRVLEATPEDGSAEGKCLARIFKTKVRFQQSRKPVQEFNQIVPL